MASKFASQFEKELQKLLRARTHVIISDVGARRGAAPTFTKKTVRKSIKRLQGLAQSAMLRSSTTDKVLFGYDARKQWRITRSKGRGRSAKRKSFKRWYDKHFKSKNCVYAFWSKKRCIYVGRTLNGKGRPSSHFEKHWFGLVRWIDIFSFNGKRLVPQFECVYTHKHEPSHSKITPASKSFMSGAQSARPNARLRGRSDRCFASDNKREEMEHQERNRGRSKYSYCVTPQWTAAGREP